MKKIYFIIILMLFFSAPITYLIILFVDKVIMSNFPFVIVEGTKDTWINFFGTLFSGITTLLALVFTIKYENEKQVKEEIKSLRPFLSTKPLLKSPYKNKRIIENNNCFYTFFIKVENVSNNLVKDLQFVGEKVFEYNTKTKKYDLDQQELLKNNKTNYNIYTVVLDECEIIAPYKYSKIQTNLGILNYLESSKDSSKSFYVKFLLKYRDAMDKMEYYHQLEYEISINYTRDGKIHIFTHNVKNKIIKEILLPYH